MITETARLLIGCEFSYAYHGHWKDPVSRKVLNEKAAIQKCMEIMDGEIIQIAILTSSNEFEFIRDVLDREPSYCRCMLPTPESRGFEFQTFRDQSVGIFRLSPDEWHAINMLYAGEITHDRK